MSSKTDVSSNLSSDPVTQIKRIVLKRRPVIADENEKDGKDSNVGESNLNLSTNNSDACENGVVQAEDTANSDCSTSVKSVESVVKQPSRKRKLQDDNDSTCDVSDNESGTLRRYDDDYEHFLSRTIKVEPEESEITIVNEDINDSLYTINKNLPEKKKRGRPRKIRDSFDNDNRSGECGGIEDKVRNEESKSGSSVSSVEKIKRGRGRPRKSDVSQTHSPSPNDEHITTDVHAKHPSTSGISGGPTGRRKIIKPRRFGSYESFEFMDVSTGDGFPRRSSSRTGDREEYSAADSFQLTQIDDDDECDDNEGAKKLPKSHDDGSDSKTNKPRKKRIVKLALGRDEENEFDAFGKNVALQLKEVSLQDALELQIQILSLISSRRLRLLGRENSSK